jgi:hypothetical protein
MRNKHYSLSLSIGRLEIKIDGTLVHFISIKKIASQDSDEAEPARHMPQSSAPVTDENSPIPHARHVSDPGSCECVPAGHGSQYPAPVNSE